VLGRGKTSNYQTVKAGCSAVVWARSGSLEESFKVKSISTWDQSVIFIGGGELGFEIKLAYHYVGKQAARALEHLPRRPEPSSFRAGKNNASC